ncbi:MAG: DNA polymerase Y family protein [Lautropia sp.]
MWAALLQSQDDGSASSDAGLAVWALQFTPLVARLDEAIVLDVEASVRLFGGLHALRDRILAESRELGATAVGWAPTSLAAVALARAGQEDGLQAPIAQVLDPLPIDVLTAVGPHRVTLLQVGCRTLGDLRRLPRGGITRRFGAGLLQALDQAYGLRPEVHRWIEIPERFVGRLELMSRVESAPALLFGARRLLLQLCGWLAARHAGTTAVELRWLHDSMRSREAGAGGALTVRTGAPMRDVEHLCRLLGEHLAKVALQAPVAELELEAIEVQTVEHRSASLLPDPEQHGESLALVLERISARLGPPRVLRPVLAEDHRPEWMQRWQPASAALPRRRAPRDGLPQPGFMLTEPLRLAVRGDRPIYQGPLRLLVGPHRVEGGWWHRERSAGEDRAHWVARDYWVAVSEHAGVLWVFKEGRARAADEPGWFLHGVFA